MLRSTGSSRSGSFFETTSTIPRSMRMSAAVFAPIPPAPSPLASSVAISSASRSLSTGDAEQIADALLVELERAALEAVGDDLVPDRRFAAGALAQHFRVVDLAQLDVPAGHRRPHARDAAVGAHRFRRPAEQQQERPPRLDVAARDGPSSRPMRWLCSSAASSLMAASGARRRPLVEQQAVGQHGDLQRLGQRRRPT